ncbi:conjugal transfer protein TraI [Mucilaginibacter aquariorum]|uniref:conjugal transfer protein TraI n=1 Tax=Mucilaginibacter aquariorum TaxID=2967225 RepID=UPI00338EF9EB
MKKVIKAIDLKVQRLQNKTIWLQNAQKVLENELSKLRLTEISEWTGDQQKLFANYYDELWKVKSTIAYYQRIKQLTLEQVALMREYQQAWALLKQDKHFSAGELNQMASVYEGILSASAKNLDQVLAALSSHTTQMTDEQRLNEINRAGDRLDENFNDLRRYNTENQILSIRRSKDLADTRITKSLYGFQ